MSKAKVTIRSVFKTIIWPRRKIFFLGLLLIAVSRLSGLVLPGASKFIMDDVISKNDLGMLKMVLLAVSGAILVQSVTSYFLTQILSLEAQRLISLLRAKVQRHILKLPIQFFDNTTSGELVSRIMNDVEGVRNLVGTGLVQMVGGVLTSVICLFLLIKISVVMTLYVLVPIIIFGLISLKAFSKIRPLFRERGKITAQVTSRLTETLNGIRVIKGFNSENQECKAFEFGVNKLFLNIKSSLMATSLITSSATFLLGLASTAIMGIGGYFIIHNQLTFGEFLAFTLYLGFMIAPIIQMSNIGSQLTEAFAGLDRTEELMNITVEDDGTRPINIDSIKGDLKFNDVSFGYKEGEETVKNISFEAKSGTVTALVGTSGSGKTTVCGLVASFLTPQKGSITIDNIELSKISLDSYRNHLGVVLQDEFLFDGTIRENILFPRPDASESQLSDAIKASNVFEFTDRFEDGLDTIIGERGIKLSGGQRQRIAIARAVLANPAILILDEATSNLDNESEALIQESLQSLVKERTTFVIAHRMSTIRLATQILVVEDGQIVERGKHDELIEKKGRYHQLYTYQSRM